ncbi:MAG: creatininase family protein [Planctomycetota bacterium]
MLYEFSSLRYPDLADLLKYNPLALLPVAQIEEHGPHLPLSADCLITVHVSRAAAEALPNEIPVLLLDLVPYGYSATTMTRWPGTIRISMETFHNYVFELCASLVDMGVRKLAVMSGHGHHNALVELVARRLADEKGIAPVVLFPHALAPDKIRAIAKSGPAGSCHAGEFETSLLLHLAPHLVDLSRAVDNPLRNFPPKGVFWSTWERERTDSGLYGAPCAASAQTGKLFFDAVVSEAAAFLASFYRA